MGTRATNGSNPRARTTPPRGSTRRRPAAVLSHPLLSSSSFPDHPLQRYTDCWRPNPKLPLPPHPYSDIALVLLLRAFQAPPHTTPIYGSPDGRAFVLYCSTCSLGFSSHPRFSFSRPFASLSLSLSLSFALDRPVFLSRPRLSPSPHALARASRSLTWWSASLL